MPHEGETTFEQLPPEFRSGEHPHARKPWALLIIFFVLIAFGAFWQYERTQSSERAPTVLPVQGETPTQSTRYQQLPSDDLQAAVNLAIPEYSESF